MNTEIKYTNSLRVCHYSPNCHHKPQRGDFCSRHTEKHRQREKQRQQQIRLMAKTATKLIQGDMTVKNFRSQSLDPRGQHKEPEYYIWQINLLWVDLKKYDPSWIQNNDISYEKYKQTKM